LADQIPYADGEKGIEDGLRTDDVPSDVKHGGISVRERLRSKRGEEFSATAAAGGAELFDHTFDQVGGGRRCIGVLVFKVHCLPVECAELVERLHLDPLDIPHGSDKSRDPVDIREVVGEAGHKRESNPYRLAERGQSLGEPKGRREFSPSHRTVRLWIGALDVEHLEIKAGQFAHNIRTEIPRRFHMDVDADKEAFFNEVYDTEHIPNLIKVPGVHGVPRGAGEPFAMSIGGAEWKVAHDGPRCATPTCREGCLQGYISNMRVVISPD
jgi:hypothetical protein